MPGRPSKGTEGDVSLSYMALCAAHFGERWGNASTDVDDRSLYERGKG